jgi:hypothetical protein
MSRLPPSLSAGLQPARAIVSKVSFVRNQLVVTERTALRATVGIRPDAWCRWPHGVTYPFRVAIFYGDSVCVMIPEDGRKRW